MQLTDKNRWATSERHRDELEKASAAVSNFDGEGEALKALEPFAKLAGPINGEAGRPTYLEAISGPNGTNELQLSTLVGDGQRSEILDAEDFRRAARVLAALSSAKRGDDDR